MAEENERDIVLAGAISAGPCDIVLRGDIVLRVIGNGSNKEIREAATEAGKRGFSIKASELVKAIEGNGPTPTPQTKTTPETVK